MYHNGVELFHIRFELGTSPEGSVRQVTGLGPKPIESQSGWDSGKGGTFARLDEEEDNTYSYRELVPSMKGILFKPL